MTNRDVDRVFYGEMLRFVSIPPPLPWYKKIYYRVQSRIRRFYWDTVKPKMPWYKDPIDSIEFGYLDEKRFS